MGENSKVPRYARDDGRGMARGKEGGAVLRPYKVIQGKKSGRYRSWRVTRAINSKANLGAPHVVVTCGLLTLHLIRSRPTELQDYSEMSKSTVRSGA